MTVTLNDRHDFNLSTFRRVAWHNEAIAFSPRAESAMQAARDSFMAMVENDPTVFIYGVTTDYGEGAKFRLDAEGRKKVAKRPAYGKGFGNGPVVADRVVRGMIFCRLTNFVEGWAAVSPKVAHQVADMLDGRALPKVNMVGNVGAGEVGPLMSLFHHLYGENCEEKDAGCLLNGSPTSAALTADAALRARNRLNLIHQVLGLSIEAANAPLEAYDPALKAMWTDDGECEALDAINAVMAGTRVEDRRAFQAPVSWRVIPRVLGQTHRAVKRLEEVATHSLSAITDNPVYVLPTAEHPMGRCISTGGYHNGAASPAMNWMAQGWADLTNIVVRQVSKLHRTEVTDLPGGLRPEGSFWGSWALGALVHDWGHEVRLAAQPTPMPIDEAGSTQDDLGAPFMQAYRQELRAGEAFDMCLALLAAASCQALTIANRPVAPKLRPLLEQVRGAFPLVNSLRDVGGDVEPIAAAFNQAAVSGEVRL
ncbi:MAG: aromatic amino acid lyase [Alphaproteobacteria bacterium]